MLQRLKLQNVGPAQSLDIEFSSRVNLITGDNGLGKSFLLDTAWWVLTRTWTHYPVRPDAGAAEPTIAYEYQTENKNAILYSSRFDWQNQEWTSKPGRPSIPGMVVYAQSDGSFSVWDPARNYWKKVVDKGLDSPNRPPAYLFRPAEVWDGLKRQDPKDPSRVEVLCNGLIRDWAAWQDKKGAAFQQLCRVLDHLSPSTQEHERLLPGEQTRISLDDVRDMPTIRMPYGKDVPIVYASAAIRRVAALAYLLVWTWQEHIQACKLLNQSTTKRIVFLIDEIEAHLHPAWQRRILRALMDVTKALMDSERVQVQVLAVTHSPMLMASMEPVFDANRDSLWKFDLVKANDRWEVILTKDRWHRRGDASAWLESDVFDLRTARSEEADRAMADAREFMRADIPDKQAFERIYLSLRQSLPGMDPFWIEWRAWGFRHKLLDGQAP